MGRGAHQGPDQDDPPAGAQTAERRHLRQRPLLPSRVGDSLQQRAEQAGGVFGQRDEEGGGDVHAGVLGGSALCRD